jgi:hypothetical protein
MSWSNLQILKKLMLIMKHNGLISRTCVGDIFQLILLANP